MLALFKYIFNRPTTHDEISKWVNAKIPYKGYIMQLNDGSRLPFEEIAGYIEKTDYNIVLGTWDGKEWNPS